MKCLIVFSGSDSNTPDNQDTILQKQDIENILQEIGIETASYSFDSGFSEVGNMIKNFKPDFIFNLVETVGNSDRLYYIAPAFYEYMNIPYTGCSAITIALTTSKLRQKKMLRLAGLQTADFITADDPVKNDENLWIVKSDTEHASVGMDANSVVKTSALAQKLIHEKIENFNGVWFAEHYIDGREFNISILENHDKSPDILSPAETIFLNYPDDKPKIVDYAAKWDPDSFGYHFTPRKFEYSKDDQSLLEKLSNLCRECWTLFDLKGAARVDFRIDKQGQPWILEINPNPCLASDAGFMIAAKQSGLSAIDVIKRLIPKDIQSEI